MVLYERSQKTILNHLGNTALASLKTMHDNHQNIDMSITAWHRWLRQQNYLKVTHSETGGGYKTQVMITGPC